jgi:hypothetical protein
MRIVTTIGSLIVLTTLLTPLAAVAGEVTKTYEFALHEWHGIDATDGPVTLHRIQLDTREGRFTKSTISRPYNQEFLETVQVQLEYTNESSGPWKARIGVRWLDEEKRVIDVISANEKLDKKAARQVTKLSLSTLKYGLERAETLEVTIHFEP